MGVGAAVWDSPTPHGDGCSDVEASGEMDVAAGACSSRGGLWWHGMWCYGRHCIDWLVEALVPAVTPIEDVGWLDPVGWHCDGPPAHKELQCFLPP
jgi:hypothetical protein